MYFPENVLQQPNTTLVKRIAFQPEATAMLVADKLIYIILPFVIGIVVTLGLSKVSLQIGYDFGQGLRS